jgi:heat shock protein HslJ
VRPAGLRALAAALALAGCAWLRSPAEAVTPEGGEWQLVSLSGKPVPPSLQHEPPSLALQAATRRAGGYGGCNRFSGAYKLEGRTLAFGPLASTRMVCAEGMELEQSFHAALMRTARWRIAGGKLELLDKAGNPLATFEQR